MTKTQIINRISRNHKMSMAEASRVVNTFCDGIVKSLKRGNSVQIAGFGSFSVRKTGGFTARNPRTGTSRKVAAGKQVYFNPATAWNPAKKRKATRRKMRRRTSRY